MTLQQPNISVIDPLRPAIEKVKVILFRPFELRKWFIIGFCAWLAYLGKSGGPNFNFGYKKHQEDFQAEFQYAKDFIIDNLPWVVLAAVTAVVVMIILWLLLTWLSSRGRFMFLHCVAQNKAEVKVPWTKLKQHANNLFLFRIVLGIIAFFATGLLCLPVIFLVVIMVKSNAGLSLTPLFGIIILSLVILVLSIAFFLVHKFTTDFVVPIMFLRTTSCVAGWREFLQILSAKKGAFILYILFQIVIAMAIVAIILAAVCITCCCAACILSIPYIGTVLMLPLLVFKRSYSLCFLRQFGPAFDVFIPETTTA